MNEDQTESDKKFDDAMAQFDEDRFDEAVAIFKDLAEKGHAQAQLQLGQCYDYGFGVEMDLDKAIEWLAKAAKQGLLLAQRWHALCVNKKIEQESLDPKELIMAYSYIFDDLSNGIKAEKEISEKLKLTCKGKENTAELARKCYALNIYVIREEESNYELFEKIHDICIKYKGH